MKKKLLSAICIVSSIFSYAQTTVTSPVTGKIWMDRNLGATQVATSIDDVDAMGGLYQWGRTTDGHQDRSSIAVLDADGITAGTEGANFIYTGWATNSWLDVVDNSRWSDIGGAQNPCTSEGAGFRVPTTAEWIAEFLVTSFTDVDAFGSFLALPHTGYRSTGDGNIYDVASTSYYWTSTPAIQKYFYNEGNNDWGSWASHGMAVRCIYDATLNVSKVEVLDFKMYPNPVENGTEINFKVSNAVKNVKVIVYDITGKEIHQQNNELRTIQLSGVSKGLYLIKFVLDNEATIVKELVIK
ncbi:MAG: T9SS type A sorting domain-containing protein [Polaribacter sp.]|uniref:T9SS type A sorting domain-containing protein n=1 Tax=Polaribacter sp. TaxID=1920175 RepID=UPI003264B751